MRNLRRVRFLLLLAALVGGHRQAANAGSVSATWTGPANDFSQTGTILSIDSVVTPNLPVTFFTGTTGPGGYQWEGGTNNIALTFDLLGGGTKSINVTPTTTSNTLSSLFNPHTPFAVNGTVTEIVLSETNPCDNPDLRCGEIFGLTGGEGGSQVFNFSTSNPVPEPADIAVLASGILGLAMVRRRRKV